MEEIKITLETLYDILRNEKKREDLQKLERTFFQDVVTYLKDKIAFLEQRKSEKDIFSSGERDKLEYELRSIRRILKEIYEKREKKIIDIALNRSRTGSDIIDTGAMLAEEKEFYGKLLASLDYYRHGILFCLFKGEMPTLLFGECKPEIKPAIKPEIKTELKPEVQPETKTVEQRSLIEPEVKKPEEKSTIEVKRTRIKFIKPLPSFVWKDMKVYGPFNIGDETEIFSEVADLIVRKGGAEKIN
jgi:DNA replication initiation complex subunit (GINS family)